MQIYQEREEKTCDKPWREKNWKIYIISRWISLNSFEPRGSLFERRWAAFSANEKLINSRWRCWQSEEHAAPRINSPPFSLLASLLVETSSFKKEKEKKERILCAARAFTRQISSPWSGGEAASHANSNDSPGNSMSFHANLLALPPRHRIENGGDETIPGGNIFFFLFFFFHLSISHPWQFKFLFCCNL